MELLDLIKNRRSIRKYQDKPIEKEKLNKIIDAGLYAPNPGGRQDTKIIVLSNPELIEKIGVINANCENRNWGQGVNTEQPSIIDDLTIKSGFYGCQSLAMVCIQKDHIDKVNPIGGAFTVSQNMVLEAYDLGISSCIVGRAVQTFTQPAMTSLLKEWGLDDNYIPIVFVCLGYINGDYPSPKIRKENRVIFVD